MSKQMLRSGFVVWPRLLALCASLFLLSGLSTAADKAMPRTVVGKVASADGSILQREAGQKKFVALEKGDAVHSADMTLGQAGSAIDSKDGTVQLRLLADLDGSSPHPILEAGVILQPPAKGTDLDFILDRGRVTFANLKKEGEAQVRVRFRDQVWDITLQEPNTLVGLELYGRWPRGVFWHKKDKPPQEPTTVVVMLVLRGSVELKHGTHEHAMKAPPGPALFQWDSVAGEDTGPRRLEALPAWANPDAPPSEHVKKLAPKMAKMREWVLKLGLEGAGAEARKSDDEDLRRVGVVILGATDDLHGLGEALNDTKNADVRTDAILVLRHWIGRGPGQDEKVYDILVNEKKVSPAQAESVVNLLHSFGPTEMARPETWETLIEYLKHDKLPMRELAAFHLYRLVPEAKDIKYNPTGSKAELEAAYKEWKKLVPDGTVPKKPKDKPKDSK